MNNFPNDATFKTAIRRDKDGNYKKQIGISKILAKIDRAKGGVMWATRRKKMDLIGKDGKAKMMIAFKKNGPGKKATRVTVPITRAILKR